ncbi:DUF3572 domain-containing protein [Profundibacter amoris]|uniref:DUF3572 family protein n=1 Tax=Profundibacter amoris TaxID=2171755 RepID=A0A347UHN0_9RHOB|nr:DUF3572 domain-containing protein [Profundibacter amoris]AXX98358.1 DUF3572 family protein [Profundibacter amoris]
MDKKQAEVRALSVLIWLVGNEELLPVFLGATGASESDLRARAGESEFLGSVLDFVMMDDAWVMAYCDGEGLPYDTLMRARQALPGGADVNWT